jgi:hypothetical protein
MPVDTKLWFMDGCDLPDSPSCCHPGLLILLTVFHMPSNEGRKKALVTCSSHLAVVGMFYGEATFMYVCPVPCTVPK